MSDPSNVGNGYRHGKTRAIKHGPTPQPQGDGCLDSCQQLIR